MIRIKKTTKKHFLIAAIVRIPLLFIQLATWEYHDITELFKIYYESGGDILLYEAFREVNPFSIIPPLFYSNGLLLMIFIRNKPSYYYIGNKILWLIYDFLNIILIIKIADLMYASEKQRRLYISSYILCPFIFLLTALRGLNEVITLFYIMASVYFFLKEQRIISYIFMSLGFMHSILPIILIAPYFLYLINKKGGFKKWFLSFPILGSVVFIISIPYLILIPDVYINNFILMLTRTNYSISYKNTFFPTVFNTRLFNINIYSMIIEITIFHIYALFIVIAFLFLFLFKFKINTKEDLIVCIVCLFLVMPLISRSFHFRQLFWLFPFISLLIIKKEKINEIPLIKMKKNETVYIFSIICANTFLIIFCIYLSYNINSQILPREIFNVALLIYLIIWCVLLLSLNLLHNFFLNLSYLIYSVYLALLFNVYLYQNFRDWINLFYLIIYIPIMIYFLIFSLSLKESIIISDDPSELLE